MHVKKSKRRITVQWQKKNSKPAIFWQIAVPNCAHSLKVKRVMCLTTSFLCQPIHMHSLSLSPWNRAWSFWKVFLHIGQPQQQRLAQAVIYIARKSTAFCLHQPHFQFFPLDSGLTGLFSVCSTHLIVNYLLTYLITPIIWKKKQKVSNARKFWKWKNDRAFCTHFEIQRLQNMSYAMSATSNQITKYFIQMSV